MTSFLVVGLGNPGARYQATRHNAGFMVVDELASRVGASFRAKFSGEVAEIDLASARALLLKPNTFMNRSGESVQAAAAFYKIPLDSVLVVHDELDVPFGQQRLKQGRGRGTQWPEVGDLSPEQFRLSEIALRHRPPPRGVWGYTGGFCARSLRLRGKGRAPRASEERSRHRGAHRESRFRGCDESGESA